MSGFISTERAKQISQEIDESTGQPCRTVANLVRAGLWKKVEGGFQIVLERRSDERIESLKAELANLTPAEKWTRYGVSIRNYLQAHGVMA
jgi:hypothetical protein